MLEIGNSKAKRVKIIYKAKFCEKFIDLYQLLYYNYYII